MKDYQLTFEEHHLNNEWFNNMINRLTPEGQLYVPLIDSLNQYSLEELKDDVDNFDDELYAELVDNVTNETVLDVNNNGGKF